MLSKLREELVQALQARWEDPLRVRAAIHPRSPVPLLDELLTPHRRQQTDTGSAISTVRHLPTRTAPGRLEKLISQIPPKQPEGPTSTYGMGPVLESLTWAYTWWAILGSNQ